MPNVPAKVYTTGPERYNRHCATHLTYRTWCPICVQAKKKERNPAHEHNASDKRTKVPVTAMDDMYTNETTDDTNNPTLVNHDTCSEGVWAVFTKKKGDSAHVNNKSSRVFQDS